MWHAYPALYKYFSTEKKHSGMASRLCNKNFLTDLALMIDILQEISLLSTALQARSLSLQRAENLIKRSIRAFEMLKESRETFEKKIEETVASAAFKDVKFVENRKFVSLPRQKLIESVIENIKKRLMDCDHLALNKSDQQNDNQIYEILNLLEPNSWKIEEVTVPCVKADKSNF